MRKKVVNVTLSNPLRRVHSHAIAQFSLFPLVPKSIQTGGQKLSKWRPDALKNLSGEGLKNTFETCVIFNRLWGPNVVQNGAQNLCSFRLLVFLAQSGPTGLSEWILRAKMEPKMSKWEAKLDPMAHYPLCSHMPPRGVKSSFSMLQKEGHITHCIKQEIQSIVL